MTRPLTTVSVRMKRKKWTEAEEETLINAYSDLLLSCGGISRLRTGEKKFQPIADRVNSLHHLRVPTSFPFRWSWRDVSIKIQNMRHQYLGVKLKLSSSSSTTDGPDSDQALHLWPNFFRYKSVFGDINSHPSSLCPSSVYAPYSDGRSDNLGKVLADMAEVLMRREESRRKRKDCDEEGRLNRLREMQKLSAMVESEEEDEERREWWRRREERREEEEMDWMEKIMGMQMYREKQAMHMHAEACHAQLQMIGILVHFVCHFLSPIASSGAMGSDAVINGLQHHTFDNLQQQQQSDGSLVSDNAKNDVDTGDDYS